MSQPIHDVLAASPDSPPLHIAPVAEESGKAALERELNQVDQEIILLFRRRAVLARRLADERTANGGSRYNHYEELSTIRLYGVLGPTGRDLARLLLRMAC